MYVTSLSFPYTCHPSVAKSIFSWLQLLFSSCNTNFASSLSHLIEQMCPLYCKEKNLSLTSDNFSLNILLKIDKTYIIWENQFSVLSRFNSDRFYFVANILVISFYFNKFQNVLSWVITWTFSWCWRFRWWWCRLQVRWWNIPGATKNTVVSIFCTPLSVGFSVNLITQTM